MKPRWTIIALLGMMLLIAALAAAQPTSFMVDGYVSCTNGDPVNDPIVTVTNLNTGEIFIAETNASSNYYQIITSSHNVSTGNVLHFNVSGSEFDHPVTQGGMDAGGFEQNATIECEPAGICGDVNDDGDVDMTDVMTLWYDIADYPTPGAYEVNCCE